MARAVALASAREAAAVLEDGLRDLNYDVVVSETRDGFLLRACENEKLVGAFGVTKAGKIERKGEGDREEEILNTIRLAEFSEKGALTIGDKEVLAREAGEEYALDQVRSNQFNIWVWEQLDQADKMPPEEIAEGFETKNLARSKHAAARLVKKMLQQLYWDIEADLSPDEVRERLAEKNLSREDAALARVTSEFAVGMRTSLIVSKDFREWVAEEIIMPIAKEFVKASR